MSVAQINVTNPYRDTYTTPQKNITIPKNLSAN
jgi:hypothetical protein